jgi:hypothetical protein
MKKGEGVLGVARKCGLKKMEQLMDKWQEMRCSESEKLLRFKMFPYECEEERGCKAPCNPPFRTTKSQESHLESLLWPFLLKPSHSPST